ncbi:hypothetical protein OHS70_35530 [Streptomyces sp. NBC_00390]|uniref:hypothetical protein n=1 Tax=Streptomyces sp. NBC_00390 TaxID=2975736 RepID=UPI002E20BA71
MKAFLIFLAFILGSLALGGVGSIAKAADTPTLVGDVVITGLLGLGAWKRWSVARSR